MLTAFALMATAALPAQGPPRLLGWNDLGMHCMDGDMSVFSILPPFNTFHAQLVWNGQLVQDGTYALTYEAVADPDGSINSTSIGKTDFWQYAPALFGVTLPPDEGLYGFRMPGAANTPQPMSFHAGLSDWVAEGVPVTPYDDAMQMRPYPLMRLTARSPQGQVLATTDIVAPVSAEMACVSCHGSGQNPAARPSGGWVFGAPAVDDRLNILKLHDERHLGDAVYSSALSALGYAPAGLLATAQQNATPVLCANCHGSIALGAAGQPGVSTLTSAMHSMHAGARLADGRTLDSVIDRSSCYTCHPGAATRCLRGAMGKAIGADGEAMMSCQDCHGSMSDVGDPNRVGWVDEPTCQACHSGDAQQNEGELRFTNVFDPSGQLRAPSNQRFATTPNAPQAPHSLYRFSSGHGDLECSACHGSPHAVWPANERNDNLQSLQTQGHVGTISECSACHSSLEDDELIGPHGMHVTGLQWVDKHGDFAEHNNGVAGCRACHGLDDRGTVLSRSHDDRSLANQFGAVSLFRGQQVGCYECHDGADSESATTNTPPVVVDRSESTPTDQPLPLVLSATDADSDPTTLRIVDQPKHGAVAFDGSNAVYTAWDGYVGVDTFTYTARDPKVEGNLGTVTVNVGAPACLGSVESFGYGCGAADGTAPTLSITGCPTGGQTIQFELLQLPEPTAVVIAMGTGQGPIELGADGCALRMSSLHGISDPIFAPSSGLTIPLGVPAGLGVWSASFQAFALAPAEPRLFVATQGVAVEFH